jgi:hypothetical protein
MLILTQGNEPDFLLTRVFVSKQYKVESLLEKLREFVDAERNYHILQVPTWFNHWGQLHLVSFWSPISMEEYWRDVNPSPSMDTGFVVWFATQWEGITDALESIQFRTAMDLGDQTVRSRVTPVYIRWFPCSGIFQVDIISAWLDRAQVNEGRCRSSKPPVQVVEWDCGIYTEPDQKKGLNTIIWSVGCTILEAVSSLLLGFRSLADDFYPTLSTSEGVPDKRLYSCNDRYSVWEKPRSTGIKPELTEWIHKLMKHSNCNRYLHDLLRLVRDRMLLIEEEKRISLAGLPDTLKHIRENCEKKVAFTPSSHKNFIHKLFGR